jgi:hypothetical protein
MFGSGANSLSRRRRSAVFCPSHVTTLMTTSGQHLTQCMNTL